jgi:hypothetical protein
MDLLRKRASVVEQSGIDRVQHVEDNIRNIRDVIFYRRSAFNILYKY